MQQALTYDAVLVLRNGIINLGSAYPGIYQRIVDSGARNKGPSGVQCHTSPIQPWRLGQNVSYYMRQVSEF